MVRVALLGSQLAQELEAIQAGIMNIGQQEVPVCGAGRR